MSQTLATLLADYQRMALIRRFEEEAARLYGMGLIGGFCHLSIGQEAVAVGVVGARAPGDQVITSHRHHGYALACGMEPRAVMAELTGRIGGASRGKGGSMHIFAPDQDFYGGHGIVGAPASLGSGLAFANRYRKNGRVAFVVFGEGAANQGQVYECFNMAALWRLPVLYIIENNRYAMGTAVERSASEPRFYRRGLSFGIPGEAVDGMNVVAVREATARAARHVRAGEGPCLLEMNTYRYRGHSMSDPARYRPREEVERVRRRRDPIQRLKRLVLTRDPDLATELDEIDKTVKQRVEDASAFAKASPEPPPEHLLRDVYSA
ncbi:MAG: pyruvate dehydrogenase (acetyl-transferring) E1 component subunit alpha [Phenylobacterium sp.]|uniref:pyruvate dehydrogenase (acetyl-transferring) E1 component subunit alpha n=1 Tax=Phenylobacterium sp. TaxID=1871053 RepID=UPI00391A397D